ncbi:MAG: corrinoid ABC transporter substrate-binding protein [Methanosaeta sp. PtaU1.Bin060]|nr:MAG: corrinoid ABC transporter substrate-binding protein [Methanosaeta sp. PtaU1.Bin060]
MRWKNFAMMIACAALMIGSAFAQGTDVPGDSNGDKIVSAEEVSAAEKLAKEGKLSADELQEIKHIHEKYPINITDSANRTVAIYKPVNTIVPMSWTDYEPIFVLGGLDKIAGVRTDLRDAYSWIPGIKDKPTIGGYQEIDYEKVIELRPDLVISAASKTDNLKNKLDPVGIPYVIIFRTLDQDAYDNDLKVLAKILEKDDRADEFITWRQNCLSQLKEKTDKIKPADRIKVYCESADHEFYTAANSSGVNEMISVAGGKNIADNLAGNPYNVDVEPEWVFKENPGAIIIAASMLGVSPESYLDYIVEENATESLDEYLDVTYNRTVLKDTDAAKQGRIYLLQGAYTDFGRGFIGAYYMAKWFYPDLFKDLNPDEINREYFEKWLGASYKGVWAYPSTT